MVPEFLGVARHLVEQRTATSDHVVFVAVCGKVSDCDAAVREVPADRASAPPVSGNARPLSLLSVHANVSSKPRSTDRVEAIVVAA